MKFNKEKVVAELEYAEGILAGIQDVLKVSDELDWENSLKIIRKAKISIEKVEKILKRAVV